LGSDEQFNFQMRQCPMILTAMLRGIKIDTRIRAEVSLELAAAFEEHVFALEPMIPADVYPRKKSKTAALWPRSPKQQAEIFYDILGLKAPRKGRSADDEALDLMAAGEPIMRRVIQGLKELRSIRVFSSTFCQAELDDDKRMRCQMDPAGTKTFRWSTKENAFGRGTNLQNIPEGTEDG